MQAEVVSLYLAGNATARIRADAKIRAVGPSGLPNRCAGIAVATPTHA